MTARYAVVAKVGLDSEEENARVVSRLQAALFREWPSPEEPMFELDATYTVHVYTFEHGPRQVEGEPDDPNFCEISGILYRAPDSEFAFSARRFTLANAGSGNTWTRCAVL
jgi:hypothetical protein